MTKKELRLQIKKKRIIFNSAQVDFLSKSILNNFNNFGFNVINKNICCFLPIVNANEVNTFFFLNYFNSFNANLVLTKTNFENKEISPHLIEDISEIQTNKYGIPEPIRNNPIQKEEIDFIIIPLLCFDKNGQRVGYGGGYYDRFLKQTCAIKIGVSLFDFLVEIDDLKSHDIPLDYCITPFNVYSFGSKG